MQEQAVNTRSATPADLDALYGIGLRAPELRRIPGKIFMAFESFLAAIIDPHGIFLVAEEDGTIIGFIYARIEETGRKHAGPAARLDLIAVVPERRGRKIGKRLVRECIAVLKAMGVNSLHCWANAEGNGVVVHMLRSLGCGTGQRYIYTELEI